MHFRKLDIHNLDFEKYTNFQKLVFKPLLGKSGFDSMLLSKEEYLWKYKGARKEGIIYTVENGDCIIGSSALVPYLMEDHFQNQFWCAQVFDNALDRNYRKKNIFYELYEKTYKNEFGYTCFGFPNEKALPTILRFNGHVKEELFFWLHLKLGLSFKDSRENISISSVRNFSEIPEISPFIESLSVRKDKEYIKWRYFDRPNRNYLVYKISDNNSKGFSLVVLTSVNYKGFKFNLILDAIGTNEFYHQNTLRLFISKIDKRGLYLALTNDHTQMSNAGFCKIPSALAPKKHYLVYTERENTPAEIKSLTWHSSMGDWEAF